jgi:hypothetical protein
MTNLVSTFISRGGPKGWQIVGEYEDGALERLGSYETRKAAREAHNRKCWICGRPEPLPHAADCLNGVLEGNRDSGRS